jgi:hypothetical protein
VPGLADDRNYDYKLNPTHLEVAKQELNRFDEICILELPETFRALEQWFPNTEQKLGANHVNEKTKLPIGLTRQEFYQDNVLDFELYEHAVNRSLSL